MIAISLHSVKVEMGIFKMTNYISYGFQCNKRDILFKQVLIWLDNDDRKWL